MEWIIEDVLFVKILESPQPRFQIPSWEGRAPSKLPSLSCASLPRPVSCSRPASLRATRLSTGPQPTASFEHHPTKRRVIVSRLFWEPPASAAAVTQGYGVCSDFLSLSWKQFLPCSSLSPLKSSHRFSCPWHRGYSRQGIWFRFECRSRCEGARSWWPSVARYTYIYNFLLALHSLAVEHWWILFWSVFWSEE